MSRFGKLSSEVQAKCLELAGHRPAAKRKRPAPKPIELIPPAVRYGTGWVELDVPLAVKNRGNANGNRWERVRANRLVAGTIGNMLCTVPPEMRGTVAGPVRVTLVRVAPRGLDAHDNLRQSLKAVVDVLATWLRGGRCGQRDGDADLAWEYQQERDQERGERYGVRVRIVVR